MATVDTLNIEIKTNAMSAAQSLKSLTKSFNTLNKALSSDKLNNVTESLKSLNMAISNVSTANVKKISKLADAMERLSKVKAMSKVMTSVSKVSEKIPTVPTPEAATENTTSDLTTTGTDLSSANKKLADTEKVTTKASKGLTKLKGTLNQCKESFKSFGQRVAEAVPLLTKFVRALGRIAFYRTVRSLFKGITDAVKEGTNNLVLYSRALNDTDSAHASSTMSRFATAILYLKNSLGALVMPILNFVVPAFEKLADVVVSVMNFINQAISVILGKSTFTKAKKYWVDYGATLDKTGGKAEKLHKQLAGFDELNNLTTNDDNGSGSGDFALNPVEMFEKANVQMNPFFEFIQKVKDTLYPYITKIVKTVKETITEISPYVKTIMENLGTIWKNVLEPIVLKFFGGFGEGLVGDIDSVQDAVVAVFEWVAKITTKWAEWSEKVKDSKLLEFFGKIATGIGYIVEVFTIGSSGKFTIGGKSVFEIMTEQVTGFRTTLREVVLISKVLMADMKDAIVTGAQKIGDKFTWVQDILDKLKDRWNILTDSTKTFKEKWDELSQGLSNSKTVMEWILDWAKKLVDLLKDVGTQIAQNGLKDFLLGTTSYSAPSSNISTANVGRNTSNFSDRVSNITENIKNTVDVAFNIVGDPQGMFKVMQKQSNDYTKMTGKSAFR